MEETPISDKAQDVIYAGFWVRLFTYMSEYAIGVLIGAWLLMSPLLFGEMTPDELFNTGILGWLGFSWLCLILFGGTPIRLITKVKIVDADTLQPVPETTRLLRSLATIASVLPLGLGVIAGVKHPQKAMWHDKWFNTRVVLTPNSGMYKHYSGTEKRPYLTHLVIGSFFLFHFIYNTQWYNIYFAITQSVGMEQTLSVRDYPITDFHTSNCMKRMGRTKTLLFCDEADFDSFDYYDGIEELKELRLSGGKVANLDMLKEAKSLEKLELYGLPNITQLPVELFSLPNLKEISMEALSGLSLTNLGQLTLPSIEKLHIEKGFIYSRSKYSVKAIDLSFIHHAPKLKDFWLTSNEEDEVFTMTNVNDFCRGGCEALESLTIMVKRDKQQEEWIFNSLNHLPKLKKITVIGGNKITLNGEFCAPVCHQLEEIGFSSYSLNLVSPELWWRDLPNLKKLFINGRYFVGGGDALSLCELNCNKIERFVVNHTGIIGEVNHQRMRSKLPNIKYYRYSPKVMIDAQGAYMKYEERGSFAAVSANYNTDLSALKDDAYKEIKAAGQTWVRVYYQGIEEKVNFPSLLDVANSIDLKVNLVFKNKECTEQRINLLKQYRQEYPELVVKMDCYFKIERELKQQEGTKQ